MRKNPEETTKAIQRLLSEHPGWLKSLLTHPSAIQQSAPALDYSKVDYQAFLEDIRVGEKDAIEDKLKGGQYNASLNVEGTSLLNEAAAAGQSEIMALLIQYGATAWIPRTKDYKFFVRTMEKIMSTDFQSKAPCFPPSHSVKDRRKSLLINFCFVSSVVPRSCEKDEIRQSFW
jgi:hypothetical protein